MEDNFLSMPCFSVRESVAGGQLDLLYQCWESPLWRCCCWGFCIAQRSLVAIYARKREERSTLAFKNVHCADLKKKKGFCGGD
jgi:hypothetical protein